MSSPTTVSKFIDQDLIAEATLEFVAHDDAQDLSFTFYRDGTADTKLATGTSQRMF